MVGGFVQNEQVDFTCHQHAQPQAALLAARQGGYRLEHVLPPKVEGGEPVAGFLGRAVLFVEHGIEQSALGMGKIDYLGKIAKLHRGTHGEVTAVGQFLPDDDFEEGRLARSVVAKKSDPLPAVQAQGDGVKQFLSPEALGQVLYKQHLVAEKIPLAEARGEGPLLLRPVGGAQALHPLFDGEGPFVQGVVAHKGPQVELFRRGRELGDLCLFFFILAEFFQIPLFLLRHVEAVISRVEFRLTLHDLHDAGDHPVQKPAVVGDAQDGALVPGEILLQPLGGVEVQVVGGLVQQEDIGILQDEPG
ncbi:hypothetical protein SDC9_86815 [bioreactor metagenome]|uniref:Uncharacterized protein n=1 Tax=bioreactor metagenome TaxID=1076179 RepID=A0A644ZH07_9ZZZZ